MRILVERGCGLDVHQATVVACLLIVRKDGRVQKQMQTFGTTTRELVSLREWLLSEGCTHLAMESTGVYWKPVYAILEGALEIVLANAQHVKKVPGRKTDVKDAEWLADLLCHGLLRSSFVPPKPIRELRDLTRYRRKLVGWENAVTPRISLVTSSGYQRKFPGQSSLDMNLDPMLTHTTSAVIFGVAVRTRMVARKSTPCVVTGRMNPNARCNFSRIYY
jgi:transposase